MPSAVDRTGIGALGWLEAFVLLVWLVGTLGLVEQLILFPARAGTGPNRDVPLRLSETPTLDEVATALWKAEVIADRAHWLRSMRLLQTESHLRGGWVVANRAMSTSELMPRLLDNRGPSTVTLLIPEGFTRFDAASRFERFGVTSRADFLQASAAPDLLKRLAIEAPSAEGYLFPATYTLPQRISAHVVVARMVSTYREHTRALLSRLAETRATARLPLAEHDALTLASIVEREARVAEERPIIAGVFVNRLVDPTFRPHRLQADPTVAYGCLTAPQAAPTCAAFDGRHITKAMVRDVQNPYNTYGLEGLPPGPICNPGLSALEAVVAPAAHDFFYFVATGDGRHSFSRTLQEHNARVHGSP